VLLLLLLQVCIYCTLLPLRESGQQLPAAVSKFMDAVGGQPAVKAGTQQVSTPLLVEQAVGTVRQQQQQQQQQQPQSSGGSS
jgi:hypothetical protein